MGRGAMGNLTKTDQQLLTCLQEGELTSLELAVALQISERTLRTHTARLLRGGLVEKPRPGHHLLTAAGRDFIRARSLDVKIGFGKVGKVIEKLPTEHHKAFLRLLLSAIVAKHHLFNTCDQGWPSFIAGGPTKTMKTAIGSLVCKLFGWDPGAYTKHVQISAKKELIGRRFWESPGKYGFTPSAYFNRPFICLDELDKAEGDLRKQALFYLQGTRVVSVEGKPVENHPLPLVTLNTDSPEDFKILESYLRRAVVFNTWPLRGELEDVDLIAGEIFDKRLPYLDLNKLTPLNRELSKEETHRLRELLKGNLNDEGWKLADLVPLKLLARGRTAFGATVIEATYQTINDYLLCSETMSWTEKGWRARVLPAWQKARGEEVEDTTTTMQELPITTEPELQARVEKVKEERFNKEDEAGELKEARARILGGLGLLKDQVLKLRGEDAKRVTASLRAGLDHDLDHVQGIAIDPLSWPAILHYQGRMEEKRPRVKTLCQLYDQIQEQVGAQDEEKKAVRRELGLVSQAINRQTSYQNKRPATPPAKIPGLLVGMNIVYAEERETQEREYMGLVDEIIDSVRQAGDRYEWERTCSVTDLQQRATRSRYPDPGLVGPDNLGIPEENFSLPYHKLGPLDPNIAEIRERVNRKDPSVKIEGSAVLVRKRKAHPPAGYKTVTYKKTVYVAYDTIGGGEFTADQLSSWGSPAIQRMLTKSIEGLKAKEQELQRRLSGLNAPESLPRLSRSPELPAIAF